MALQLESSPYRYYIAQGDEEPGLAGGVPALTPPGVGDFAGRPGRNAGSRYRYPRRGPRDAPGRPGCAAPGPGRAAAPVFPIAPAVPAAASPGAAGRTADRHTRPGAGGSTAAGR